MGQETNNLPAAAVSRPPCEDNMAAVKTCKFPVRLLARDQQTPTLLRALSESLHADRVDPLAYKCRTCGIKWKCCPLDDYRQVVCSNCYGEDVLLTWVRLEFCDWGERNGGAKEQHGRWAKATAQGERLRPAAGKS